MKKTHYDYYNTYKGTANGKINIRINILKQVIASTEKVMVKRMAVLAKHKTELAELVAQKTQANIQDLETKLAALKAENQ